MKNFFKFGFVALLTIAAGFAVAGMPIIPAEVLASIGFGMVPFAGEIGGDMKKMLDNLADTAKSAKDTVESVKKAHTELDGRVQKLHEEMASGKADAITKSAFQTAVDSVSKVEKALDKVNAELTELAAKAVNGLGAAPQTKTIGQMAAESEVCKTYRGGIAELAQLAGPLFGKANVTSAAASAGALVQPYRVPGVVMSPDEPLTMRDLFQAVSINSNAIEWVKEKLFTNNAGAQAAEGASKNESGLTFEKMTTAVATLAHWIPVSRQVLADAPQLAGTIDGKLRTGLKLKEDRGLLFGDGLNGNLHGIVPQAVAYVSTGIPAQASKIDHLRWAFLQVAKAQYPATFAVLSLDDWALIQMMKTTDGAYIFGTPTDGAAPRIWGKRVVESFGMDAGDFLAGSSLAATLYDREDVTVRVAEQHGDFFIKNMVAILCEERIGMTVERPAAMVSGAFA